MAKKAKIELYFQNGNYVEREIIYRGKSASEEKKMIEADRAELLHYMQTKDLKGAKSFCFGGFIFQKSGIIAAQLSEKDI